MLRGSTRLRAENPFHDGNERLAPALERRGIAGAELCEGFDRALEVAPPAERVTAPEEQRDVQFGLKILCAAALKAELAVPRQLVQRAMEERMDVVPVAGPARIFDRRESAADRAAPLEAHGLQPRAPEVRLQHEAVVPRAEKNDVVAQSPFTGTILIDLSRNSLV